ncbi:hypothetical protein [Pseudovibrio sp. SCP19]|uniref:hypothetical protein n=1 Tax=Pseudovibrio sp. SCP19 TaxID=3141374 RepID=UPI00333DD3C2
MEACKKQLDKIKENDVLLKNSTHSIRPDIGSATFTYFDKLDADGKKISENENLGWDGSKIHISVQANQIDAACNVLTLLLLSPDNPFVSFKVTNVERAQADLEKDIKKLQTIRPIVKNEMHCTKQNLSA